MNERTPPPELRDDFADSPARRAVVATVRAFGTIQQLMAPYFAEFDLTPPQFQMLTVINRLKDVPLTQRRLARELYVSFPNITMMLARLETAGLVERNTDPTDGRQKLVKLTRRGTSLLRRIWKGHQDQLEHVMSGLDDNERNELVRLLNRIIEAHADASASPAATDGNHSPR